MSDQILNIFVLFVFHVRQVTDGLTGGFTPVKQ